MTASAGATSARNRPWLRLPKRPPLASGPWPRPAPRLPGRLPGKSERSTPLLFFFHCFPPLLWLEHCCRSSADHRSSPCPWEGRKVLRTSPRRRRSGDCCGPHLDLTLRVQKCFLNHRNMVCIYIYTDTKSCRISIINSTGYLGVPNSEVQVWC